MFMKRALELEQCHFYDGSTAQETTRLFHKKLHEYLVKNHSQWQH